MMEPFHVPTVIVPTVDKLDKAVTVLVINVPEVGMVTDVAPVRATLRLKAPVVARLPLNVMVLEPLLTPVPPYVGLITEAFQVPAVSVPTPVMPV